MKAIEIINLTKKYESRNNTFTALDNINISIEEGSSVAFLGPNGAGKSTFINIMAGIIYKTSGKVFIKGYDIDKNLNDCKHKLGVIPQEMYSDPFFKIKEMLEITSLYYGIRNNGNYIDKLLAKLHLSDKANEYPRALSGGMKKRFSIAKALVHNPEIVILDEPTAGIDIELRNKMLDYVQMLHKNEGKTIMLTTHYIEEAEKLCDRIIIIGKGRIIADDSKQSLIGKYGNRRLTVKIIDKENSDLQNFSKEVDNFPDFNYNQKARIIGFNYNSISLNKLLSILASHNIKVEDINISEPNLNDVVTELLHHK